MSEEPLVCIQIVELATDYLENALTSEDRLQFDEHVAYCRGCQNYMDEFAKVIRFMNNLHAESISNEARSSLHRVFNRQGLEESS